MNRMRSLAAVLVVAFVATLLLLPASSASAAPAESLATSTTSVRAAAPVHSSDRSAKPRRYWGSISISSDHTFAYAIDKSSKKKAIRLAYNKCKSNADYPQYCVKATWFSNYCAAIYYKQREDGFITKYKIGYGRTRPVAIRHARNKFDHGAKFLGYACTTRYR